MNMNSSEDMKTLIKKVDEMMDSMQYMNEKFEAALKELQESRKENMEYKQSIDHLKSKVVNLEISGLPCKNDENCHLVAYNIIKEVYPEAKQDDITEAYRIGSPKDPEGKPRSYRNILIKLKERRVRDQVYKNKKRLRAVDTVKMGLSSEKQRVFINENLSRESKALFKKANEIRKQKSWRYIWSNYGAILMRKSDDSQVLRIRSDKDLDRIN